ncbi:glycosyltransferase [Buttiauxella ferragutiae]|uniref:glycosyltransferase n=1 Tax=Buttiauxella ferragutiae TaxID=82989 RepID=UPI001F52FEE2|nr:glycosyltransferase [Buttiauxella ferragutiae]UNK62854.1 glycosyltransferase [Buttiauxella ferragutiae]
MRSPSSPEIIFNCATNVIGGAVQNAVHFIRGVINFEGFGLNWYFILSPQVYAQVKQLLPPHKFIVLNESPAFSLRARRLLGSIVQDIKPQLVYSSAGPAYVKFSVPHVMGCSNPYILGASDYAYELYGGFLSQLKIRLRTKYQTYKIKQADAWITQTESSANNLKRILGNNSDIYIVYNSISPEFLNYLNDYSHQEKSKINSITRILVPTAYYQHKDLERIPQAIARLREKYGVEVKITLTINDKEAYKKTLAIAKDLNIDSSFQNIGGYEHKDSLKIYTEHDVVLQPSVLEVFSTSYIEAMSALKPLIVPSFDFSKSICADYAHYYDCLSIDSYAAAIYAAIVDTSVEERHEKSIAIVSKYGSQDKRVAKIVEILKKHIIRGVDCVQK